MWVDVHGRRAVYYYNRTETEREERTVTSESESFAAFFLEQFSFLRHPLFCRSSNFAAAAELPRAGFFHPGLASAPWKEQGQK
jgi:hypothetical protein